MFNVRRGKLVAFLVLTLALIGGAAVPVFAQATSVSTFEELKAAVENGGDIVVEGTIDVTETLEIGKEVNISGGSLKLGPNFSSDEMFRVGKDKKLNLKSITLDGGVLDGEKAGQGRFINVKGGTVNLEYVT